jgi:hypothetical protein
MNNVNVYPINIHALDGKMICSLAYKQPSQAIAAMEQFEQSEGKGVIKFSDSYGHDVIVNASSIGFVIYVDAEKDAELAHIYHSKQLAAELAQKTREKLITN